jgi:DNA-binding MarR family transcriptional regulator
VEGIGPLADSDPQIGMSLRRAEQALLSTKNAALKPIGLTLAQYVALARLEEQPGITGATLARACLVTPQAMMVVLKALEEQGLISRDAHPRHPNVLELRITDAGREALHAGRREIEPLERRVTDSFSSTELETLSALLNRLIAVVESTPAVSPPGEATSLRPRPAFSA